MLEIKKGTARSRACRRITCTVLTIIMIVSMCLPVFAESGPAKSADPTSKAPEAVAAADEKDDTLAGVNLDLTVQYTMNQESTPVPGCTVKLSSQNDSGEWTEAATLADAGQGLYKLPDGMTLAPGKYKAVLEKAPKGSVYVAGDEVAFEVTSEDTGTKAAVLEISEKNNIPDLLEGDNAYIKNFKVKEGDGYKDKALKTGSAPFDEDDKAGNDSSAANGIVRSFDTVAYTVSFNTFINDAAKSSGITAYYSGTVYFEFVLEGDESQIRFETDSMGWLASYTDCKYEIVTATLNGKTCQVLRGSYLAMPSDGNKSAIGNSYSELSISYRVLAMNDGDAVEPSFTLWLQDNEVGTSYEDGIPQSIVTGSGYKCPEHEAIEYQTVVSDPINISAAPRYNIAVVPGSASYCQMAGTFDFDTGKTTAPNYGIGKVSGRQLGFGVRVEIDGKENQGLKGIELPDESKAITFDLDLSSTYKPENGKNSFALEGFDPILWSGEANTSNTIQTDGRTISAQTKYINGQVPFNKGTNYNCCNDGGTWTFTIDEDDKTIVHVSITGMKVDLTKLPYSYVGSDVNKWYTPDVKSKRGKADWWNIQTAVLSAGEVWVIQPYYSMKDTDDYAKGTYVASISDYGSGTFNTILEDVVSSLKMESVQGQSTEGYQASSSDDKATFSRYLSNSGSIESCIKYSVWGTGYYGDPLTAGHSGDGGDWAVLGQKLSISPIINNDGGEGEMMGVAYDNMAKFDDQFFEPVSVNKNTSSDDSYTRNVTYLWGAKKDGSGWDHKGLKPDEDGYDDEMLQATEDDLVWYSSLEALKADGKTPLAVLQEVRGLATSSFGQRNSISFYINGTVKESCPTNYTYMTTLVSRAWYVKNLRKAVDAYTDYPQTVLDAAGSDEYVKFSWYAKNVLASRDPSATGDRVSIAAGWNKDHSTEAGYANSIKADYNKSGAVYPYGSGEPKFIDSCLVVAYNSTISKEVAQTVTNSDTVSSKSVYDMGTNQRTVDYVLDPKAVRTGGVYDSTGSDLPTTVTITDTLPASLTYGGKSYWDKDGTGTYTQDRYYKKAGSCQGMTEIEPKITVNDDGTTTLVWTLEDVVVKANEPTSFGKIYYSAVIGTEGNEETDVTNLQQITNNVSIYTTHDNNRAFNLVNENYDESTITINKLGALSLSKVADQEVVDAGDPMGYTMNVGNNSSSDKTGTVIVDSLPFNGDERGSTYSGERYVSEFSAEIVKKENDETTSSKPEVFRFFYTTDKKYRGLTAEDLYGEGLTDAASFIGAGWTELTEGSGQLAKGFALPDQKGKEIVSIAAIGNIPAQSTLKLHVTLDEETPDVGDTLVNSLSQDNLESTAKCAVVERKLSGQVWIDSNMDGVRSNSESSYSRPVAVTLKVLNDEGQYEDYTLTDGSKAVISTGQQLDLLTGKITEYTEGSYLFSYVPEGTFAVEFGSGAEGYYHSPVDQGSDDSRDSDAKPTYKGSDLISADITGISMPKAKDIKKTSVYESGDHDLGIFQRDITVKKSWDDSDNIDGMRTTSVTVTLKADGGSYADGEQELNEKGFWTYKWEKVPVYTQDGDSYRLIKYTLSEESIDGYSCDVEQTASSPTGAITAFAVKNSHTPETTSVSVSKIWSDDDDRDGKRPDSVTFRLSNGDEITLDGEADDQGESEAWVATWKDLPKYQEGKQGQKIDYTVTETSSDKGYTVSYGGGAGYAVDGGQITNSHTPETTSVSVSKIWSDDDDRDGKRPDSVTFRLSNGDEITLDGKADDRGESEAWVATWEDLPVYDKGEKIDYTVTETSGDENYTVSYGDGADYAVDGGKITNSYTPETTSVSVSKVWSDDDDRDGKRPDSVTFRLSNGDEITLDGEADDRGESEAWVATWEDLPKYEKGKEIDYTVTETSSDKGYTVSYGGGAGYAVDGGKITNSHTPETTAVNGIKTWNDSDLLNSEGYKRPDSIKVTLHGKAGDEEIVTQEKTVSANDDGSWSYSFKDLDVYQKGQVGEKITYTVTEAPLDGWTTEYGDDNEIRNTPNSDPKKDIVTPVTLNIDKVDANTAGRLDGAEFTVTPLAGDGSAGGKAETVEGNGSCEISSAGSYRVKETKSPAGYRKVETEYTITVEKVFDQVKLEDDIWVSYYHLEFSEPLPDTEFNAKTGTLTVADPPTTRSVTAEKIWDDSDDQDGKRRDIQLTLYDGDKVAGVSDAVVTLGTADGEAYTWKELPAYRDGEPIEYSVMETQVPDGYTSSAENERAVPDDQGLVRITNTHQAEMTQVTVNKVWKNMNAKGAGKHRFGVALYADGEEVEGSEQTLASTDTSYTWTELPKYSAGHKIEYSVKETDVPEKFNSSTADENSEVDDQGLATIINTYTGRSGRSDGDDDGDDDDDGVNTGDSSQPLLALALLTASLAGIAALLLFRRRREAR